MAVVDMLVADALLPELPGALLLMKARELASRPAEQSGVTIVTLEVDGAPDGACGVEPIFQVCDGVVSVQTMNWRYTA